MKSKRQDQVWIIYNLITHGKDLKCILMEVGNIGFKLVHGMIYDLENY